MDDVAPAARAPSRAYSNYVLGVLVAVYVMNYVDRQLISILIEPIKAEFGASDKQMGLLTGFAFAIFYTVAGIPVARLADVWVRRSVIAIGLSLWSGMTALTGFSRSFLELALVRIGVGIGEAGGTPPSHALISDYFPPKRRATALGIFSLGVPIGTILRGHAEPGAAAHARARLGDPAVLPEPDRPRRRALRRRLALRRARAEPRRRVGALGPRDPTRAEPVRRLRVLARVEELRGRARGGSLRVPHRCRVSAGGVCHASWRPSMKLTGAFARVASSTPSRQARRTAQYAPPIASM
jgi:hypothetical protein